MSSSACVLTSALHECQQSNKWAHWQCRPWVIITSKSLFGCSVKVSQSVSVPAHLDWSESEDFINHMDIMVRNNMGQSGMADIYFENWIFLSLLGFLWAAQKHGLFLSLVCAKAVLFPDRGLQLVCSFLLKAFEIYSCTHYCRLRIWNRC